MRACVPREQAALKGSAPRKTTFGHVLQKQGDDSRCAAFESGWLPTRLHPADFLTRQTLTEYVFAHQFLGRSTHHCLSLDLWSEVAQHFHRALIGDVRARRAWTASGSGPRPCSRRHSLRAAPPSPSQPVPYPRSEHPFRIRPSPDPRSSGPPACGGPETNAGRCGPNRPHSPFGANSITAMAIRPSVIRYQLP